MCQKHGYDASKVTETFRCHRSVMMQFGVSLQEPAVCLMDGVLLVVVSSSGMAIWDECRRGAWKGGMRSWLGLAGEYKFPPSLPRLYSFLSLAQASSPPSLQGGSCG